MAQIRLYGLSSVAIISLISLIGVATLGWKVSFLKRIVIFLVSLSAGALLGDVFLHLLPELIEGGEFNLTSSLIILGGIVFGFIIEKILHRRHCHMPSGTQGHQHPLALMNIVGDAMHNLLDGLIIGASYLVSIEVGMATTVAVLLHEIPQEIGDFGVLVHSGLSVKKALLINFMTALTAIIGLVIALLLGQYVQDVHHYLIPVAIGMFIYIAGADLIPEMHKETNRKQSIGQIFFFLMGIGSMTLLLFID